MAEQNRTEQNRTEQNRTEQNRTEQNSINIIRYYMSIPGWHRIARVVLNPKGICTTITAQSNNLLQKVLVKVD